MDQEKYDLISCHSCLSKFEANQDVVVIAAKQFDLDWMHFTHSITDEPIRIERVIRFCRKCFLNIGGKEYLP